METIWLELAANGTGSGDADGATGVRYRCGLVYRAGGGSSPRRIRPGERWSSVLARLRPEEVRLPPPSGWAPAARCAVLAEALERAVAVPVAQVRIGETVFAPGEPLDAASLALIIARGRNRPQSRTTTRAHPGSAPE